MSPFEQLPDPALLGNVWFDAFHAFSSYLDAREFDVVHDHSGVVGPSIGAMLDGRPPVVHTLHGPWTEPARRYYSMLQDRVHLVAISESQASEHPDLRYAATVHNGIDIDTYPYREDKEDFLVYIGRANPDKGPVQAIEVARLAGLPLAMLVKRNEPFELAYWDEAVAPKLTDDVELYERVTHEVKADLLAPGARDGVPDPVARAVRPRDDRGDGLWDPGRGLPARRGDGDRRRRAHGVPALVDRGPGRGRGSRRGVLPTACRERVVEHFSAESMVTSYERIFESVVGAAGSRKA